MGVERVDYSSDEDYQQALQMESWQEQQWQEEQEARRAEEQMIAEEMEKESAPLDGFVMSKIADLDDLKKLYKDLCKRSDIYYQKTIKHKDNELKEVYENRNIGITEAIKWLRNYIRKYDSKFTG